MTNAYLLTSLFQCLVAVTMIMLGAYVGRAVRPGEEGWVLGGVAGSLSGAALAAWIGPYLHAMTQG